MDRWKAEMGRVREEKRRRKIKDNKNQKKEDLGARKGRTVAIHCVFPVICGSGGSKSKLGAMWPDERWKVARRCGAKHIRSAIRDSQQPSFPIGFLFWNFRHRLVRYYWDRTVTKNEGKKRDNHASPVSGIPCSKQFWRIWIIKAPSAQPLHGCDMQQFWVGKRDYESARKWRVQTVFKRMQRIALSHHLGKGNKMQSNVSYVVSLELNLLKHRRPIEAQQHKHQMYEVNPSHVCTCSESLMIIHVRGHRSFSHFPPLQNKAPGWRSHKLGTWLHRVHPLSYQVLHILTLWKLKLNRGNECLAGCPQWYCTCIWKTGSTPWHRGWDVVKQLHIRDTCIAHGMTRGMS